MFKAELSLKWDCLRFKFLKLAGIESGFFRADRKLMEEI